MEIKDTKDIIYDNYKIHHTKLGKDIRPKKHDTKRWIAVDGLIEWIQDNLIDGTMSLAEGDFLKGQKNGEMMMLRKIKEILTLKTKKHKLEVKNEKKESFSRSN